MPPFSWPNDDSPSILQSYKPLWSVDIQINQGENELIRDARILKWLNETYDKLQEDSIWRTETQKGNICRYKGYYYGPEPMVGGARIPNQNKSPRWPRIVVNHTQDLVEQKVAKLTRYKPSTNVIPSSNENEDKIDSEIAKKLLDSIKYEKDLESIYARMCRRAIIFGESFVWVRWNPNIGEEHPQSKNKKSKGQRVKLLGKDGEAVKSDDGDALFIDKPIRIGDVDFQFPLPWDVFLLPTDDPTFLPGVIVREWVHVDELRAQYPGKAHMIEPTRDARNFDFRLLEDIDLKDYCLKLYVYYQSSDYVDKGLYFVATPTCLLEEVQDNPYDRVEGSEFGNIPFERLTDVDIESEFHGYPSQCFINPLQVVYDKLTSLMNKNIAVFSHPKWIVQRGTYNPLTFGNEGIILEHWGSIPPNLQSYQVITADVFNYRNSIKDEMQMIFGIFSGSRGEAPAGARAANILYYYDEQESQRASNFVRKFNKLVVNVDRKILSTCAKYYKNHDGRLLAVMGKDKTWIVESFDVESLSKPFDIRVVSSSGLPDNKYARIDTLIKLFQISPQDPEVRTMLFDQIDFGQDEKFLDYQRVAVMAAEAENECFQKGDDVKPAELYEEQLIHWTIHSKLMQNRAFKMLNTKTQDKVRNHVRGHEEIILNKMMTNEVFRQRVLMHPDFPLIQTLPPGGLMNPGPMLQAMPGPGGPPMPNQPKASVNGVSANPPMVGQ